LHKPSSRSQGHDGRNVDAGGTDDRPQSYADYLRARELYRAGTSDSLEQASALLEHVVAVDDDYSPGWRLLAQTYSSRAWAGFLPLHEGFAKARAAIQRAIDIDPSDAAAIALLAALSRAYDLNLPEAARLLKRALSLSAHDETALRAAGKPDADDGRRPAHDRNLRGTRAPRPRERRGWSDLGFAYMIFGRYADAMQRFGSRSNLNPRRCSHTRFWVRL
jgi:tetratricopeptide (TPR) repeat protein